MQISVVSLDILGLATPTPGGDGLPTEANAQSFHQAMLQASLIGTPPYGTPPYGSEPPLKAVALGSVELITPNAPAPEANELKAFAAAQGLSPEAVAWLFNKQETSTSTSTSTATNNLSPENTDHLPLTDINLAADSGTAQNPTVVPKPSNTIQADSPTDVQAAMALLATVPLGLAQWAPLSSAPTTAAPVTSSEPNVLPTGWQSTQALLNAGGKPTVNNPVATNGQPPIPEEVMDLLDLDPETHELLTKLGLLDKDSPSPKTTPSGQHQPVQQIIGMEQRTPLDTLQRPTLLAGQGMAAPTATQAENATPADRAAQIQALSEKIGQALGQRLMGHIERGQWQVRLLLRPANLGEVEVDLRLRAGELDATLRAMNPLTRELLIEGLPRLREGLTQAGMDVAQLHVGTGETSRNGGNPTPRDFARQAEQSGSGAAQASAGNQPDEVRVKQRTGGADGWDVMV